MANRLRVYMPQTGSGTAAAQVYVNNVWQYTVHSRSDGNPDFDQSGITTTMAVTDLNITQDGWVFKRWVVSKDNGTEASRVTSYSTSANISVAYDPDYTNIYIRAEVEEVVTYYARLAYDANGGSGAPSTQSGSSTSGQYVQFNIPNTVPTRSGYVFQYWQLVGYSSTKQPGDSITVGGSTSSPGTLYTLQAVWAEESSGIEVYIYNGSSWVKYEPYIYNGTSWVKYEPHVYDGDEWL